MAARFVCNIAYNAERREFTEVVGSDLNSVYVAVSAQTVETNATVCS